MEENAASCIIHFGDISNEFLRQFTAVSLSKFIHCRKQWLTLTGAQNEVAVNSLEYFTDLDEEKFSSDETIPQRSLQYHIDCYRRFTDKTKIERAQRSAKALPGKSKISEPAAKKTKVDSEEYTTTRGRLSRAAAAGSKSTHVLPRVCLICKKEELTYTCPVTKKRTIQKLTQSQTFDAGKLRLAAKKKMSPF
ncbi:uncharacterized protein LOC114538128 [Dendronephthya gigantea]|uniref:uncharacterized protein LOC114538128 n=1 Tax=Dendronephthya gigantea TaxID=151771 RepID=UPI001069516F|nr:uncharacterized protein LOC114538128 [Dendronephthya gigantea]